MAATYGTSGCLAMTRPAASSCAGAMNGFALVTSIVAPAGALASIFLIWGRDFVSASVQGQDSAGKSALPWHH